MNNYEMHGNYTIAPVYRRVGAYIIDLILVGIISALLCYLMAQLFSSHVTPYASYFKLSSGEFLVVSRSLVFNILLGDPITALTTSSITTIILMLLYFTLFTASKWQATLGQWLMSIHVISLKAKKLDLKLAFYRFLLSLLVLNVLSMLVAMHYPFLDNYPWAVSAVSVILGLVGLGWVLSVFYYPENQTVYDHILDQRVVQGRL